MWGRAQHSFTFPETQFITVTAYQNSKVKAKYISQINISNTFNTKVHIFSPLVHNSWLFSWKIFLFLYSPRSLNWKSTQILLQKALERMAWTARSKLNTQTPILITNCIHHFLFIHKNLLRHLNWEHYIFSFVFPRQREARLKRKITSNQEESLDIGEDHNVLFCNLTKLRHKWNIKKYRHYQVFNTYSVHKIIL